MKLTFTFLLVFMGINLLYATNYYTSSDGNINTAAKWVGNSKPPGGCSTSNAAGDSIFISDNMTISCTQYQLNNAVIIIKSTGSLTVTGAFAPNNGAKLIIESGGSLVTTGDLIMGSDGQFISTGGSVVIGGNFETRGTVNILESSDFTVKGMFGGTSNTVLNIDGVVNADGGFRIYSSSINVGETGVLNVKTNNVTFGNASLNNNGYIYIEDATSITDWNGSSNNDCDGSLGTGVIGFGNAALCGTICGSGASGSGYCFDNSPPPSPMLPVTWLTVQALDKMGSVEVFWSTASEENNNYFVIERSLDGESWLSIGSVDGAGTSSRITNYSFLDNETVSVLTYYRIKQVDFDGQFDYSKIVVFIPGSQSLYTEGLYPNPNEGLFYIDLGEDEIVSLSIVDSKGSLIEFDYSILENLIKIEIDGFYSVGFYTSIMVTQKGVYQRNFIIR